MLPSRAATPPRPGRRARAGHVPCAPSALWCHARRANPSRGYRRVCGELLVLGVKVAASASSLRTRSSWSVTKNLTDWLEAALPSMTRWRAAARRSVDWAALEADLGTALPSDYRSLAEAYPLLLIDDFLAVSIPRPGAEALWASASREDEILQDLYEMGDTEDYVPFPQPGGLIRWAESNSGDCFYRRTSPADPDAWPVVVRTDNGEWIEFPVGAVEFLAGVYGRTLHVPGMPGNFPSDFPQVLGLSDRTD